MTVLLYVVNMVVGIFITIESQLKSKPTGCNPKKVVRVRVSPQKGARKGGGIAQKGPVENRLVA